MSLPMIGEHVTAEQLEEALKNGSIILQQDGMDGHYGWDADEDHYYFEFYGDCVKRKIHHGHGEGIFRHIPSREEICVEWRFAPYKKYFDSFQAMTLWAAFVGMDWT